jgi:transposase
MRKGFDTLAEAVRTVLELDPLSGHLFVFRSRDAHRINPSYAPNRSKNFSLARLHGLFVCCSGIFALILCKFVVVKKSLA